MYLFLGYLKNYSQSVITVQMTYNCNHSQIGHLWAANAPPPAHISSFALSKFSCKMAGVRQYNNILFLFPKITGRLDSLITAAPANVPYAYLPFYIESITLDRTLVQLTIILIKMCKEINLF